jgi:hypothetical protein
MKYISIALLKADSSHMVIQKLTFNSLTQIALIEILILQLDYLLKCLISSAYCHLN